MENFDKVYGTCAESRYQLNAVQGKVPFLDYYNLLQSNEEILWPNISFFVFYGPLASWGLPAVGGDSRQTGVAPSRSAILGFTECIIRH